MPQRESNETDARAASSVRGSPKEGYVWKESALIYEPKASELLMLLRRALNTLDPQKAPEWAVRLCDVLEERCEHDSPDDPVRIDV
jgi:hypothetical protein